MENRKLIAFGGTREDVLPIVRELQAMAEGPITLEGVGYIP